MTRELAKLLHNLIESYVESYINYNTRQLKNCENT